MQASDTAAAPKFLTLEPTSNAPLVSRAGGLSVGKPAIIAASLAGVLAWLVFRRKSNSKSPRKSGSVVGTILKSVLGAAAMTIIKQKLMPHPQGAKIGLPFTDSEAAD